MTILLDVVLALAEGVPQLDGAVARTRDNLAIVSTEADGENIGGVSNEAAGGKAGVQVPKAEGVVPGRGECKLAIGGDDDVRHEVVVAVENALGVTVGLVVAGELPDDDRLVWALLRWKSEGEERVSTSGRGEDHVRVLGRRRDGRHPSLVAFERAQVP